MQSPINIDPRHLLYDPHLSKFSIAQNSVKIFYFIQLKKLIYLIYLRRLKL